VSYSDSNCCKYSSQAVKKIRKWVYI